jgi:phosphoglycolate phosphatase
MPTPTPPLFLFDIDGTLLKGSTRVHRDAFAHAFRSVYGLPLSLDEVQAAGRTDRWLLHEVLRRHGMPEAEVDARMPEAFAVMEAYVDEHLDDLRRFVLPGVPDLLAALDEAGCLLGLLTGNLSRIAFAKMRHAGLARYFDTGGFGEESATRADLVPVAIAKAGEKVGCRIAPAEAAVIGDTPLDVEAGKAHGTRTVGVATGPFTVDQLRDSGADLTLASFQPAGAAAGALLTLMQPPA